MKALPTPAGQHRPIVAVDWDVVLADCDRWLRTVVFSRLRDCHATDEVMQEVALAAVRQAAPLRDQTKAAPWLYRLAVRQVLLYRRKKGRQRKLPGKIQLELKADDVLSVRTPGGGGWGKPLSKKRKSK